MKCNHPRATALAALVLALPAAAPAQDREQAPPDATFVERLEVEIVNLDVVVTDREGRPVEGLGRDDFILRVDGEPTPIDNFYAVGAEERGAAAPAAPPAEEGGAPAAPAAGPPAVSPLDQELHLVILFDNVHATAGERKRVAEDLAAAFEDGLGAHGRAAVAYYDGGIKVREPFTADGAAIAAAIRELGRAQVGYADDFQRRNILREIDQVSLGDNTAGQEATSLLGSIEILAEQQAADVRRTLSALRSKVESLAGLPGRKALLYVTSGLEMQPGQALLAAWFNKFGGLVGNPREYNLRIARGAGHDELGAELRELTRRANAGRVALYAIGTALAGASQAVSAEEGGFDAGALTAPGGGRTYDVAIDTLFRTNLGSGLELMAAVTGGDALTGSGNYDLIAQRVRQDAGYRYSLGFRAPEGEPGASYRVEVEVPGRRASLRYRREFVTATPAERASERTLAALLWGVADNSIGIAADFGEPQRSKRDKGLFVLPILVKVPFVNVVLLPEPRVHRGRVTIFVAAEDDDGRVSPVQSLDAPIEIPADRLAEMLRGVGGFRVGLLVRPGPHRFAIGVRDELGDAVSTLRLDHVVAPGGK